MINALLFAIYAMATAAASLWLVIGRITDAKGATVVGVVTVALLAQLHGAILRRRERKAAGEEIAQLKRNGKDFFLALADMQRKIAQVEEAADARADAQSRKIVSELKMLEGLMREFAGRISQKAKDVKVAEVAPVAAPAPAQAVVEKRREDTAAAYIAAFGQSDLLETIRASLEENRVDLYLQPIVSLPQRKLRFYEALSRLRSEDGTVIMPAQYMKVAGPVGLMSVVDNLLLFRCVQIVRKMIHKSRGIGVFCNISGETLADAEFFPQFLEFMHHNRDLASQIVFEFDQHAVLNAGQKGEENLLYLSTLGFALSMDHVETLAMDFEKLKTLGFRHIKVRAGTLIGGMADAQAAVAAEDLKSLLARHGLNLIAERVETEKTVVQLLDYSVDFAQGYLFGEPKPLREDSLRTLDRPEPSAPVIPFRKAG
ncbi:MAG TPA: EAL domain-containing protein [Rhizomicrobium sp.]|nr:EAL domain-containing protein [Rhizomicrobium sp.]